MGVRQTDKRLAITKIVQMIGMGFTVERMEREVPHLSPRQFKNYLKEAYRKIALSVPERNVEQVRKELDYQQQVIQQEAMTAWEQLKDEGEELFDEAGNPVKRSLKGGSEYLRTALAAIQGRRELNGVDLTPKAQAIASQGNAAGEFIDSLLPALLKARQMLDQGGVKEIPDKAADHPSQLAPLAGTTIVISPQRSSYEESATEESATEGSPAEGEAEKTGANEAN